MFFVLFFFVVLILGVFGVIDLLNVVNSRWCCDIISMGNVSFVKFVINDISFGISGELFFFIWMWELSGFVVFMVGIDNNYIVVVVYEGILVV